MKTIFNTCLFTLLCIAGFTQVPKYRVVSVPVERNNIQLRQPWVGGMNSPQFSSIDLNGDNNKDLFVFDRVGDKVLTYINNGNGTDSTFDYSPKYEKLFPAGLNAWAFIRDYNNDGIADIFAHTGTGTVVFKGKMENGYLAFDTVVPLLMYSSPPYSVNIWTSISDLPVFTDVNFDGDIDVLTYGVFGATIEYYENQTVEHAGEGNPHFDVDSFQFLSITNCWGNIVQNSVSNSITLNQSCKGTGGMFSQSEGARHAGNAIFSFDDNNDHDVDLLNGNIGYNNLAFLNNGGDSSYANITYWDSIFPSCNITVDLPSYPAAFGVDANNDALEDLLISPNAYSGGRDVHNVMLYKNLNNHVCNFQYQGDSFLVHEMLDFGSDSKPVFFDFTGDGLKDIVVGNFGYFRPFQTYKGTLSFYENIGTLTQPKYKMVTEDYTENNFPFSNYLLVAPHPAFGDLNGDGHDDMVVGELNGYLHYFKNSGSAAASFPTMTTPQMDTIDVGQYSAPFIYDMNGDSLLDLVVGKKDGKVSYYWNYGTKTNPKYSKDSVNTSLGNINVTQNGSNEGYAQPVVVNDNGSLIMYVGSNSGRVYKYGVNSANLRSGGFTLLDSDFLKDDIGTKAVISIADINSDGLLEYVVGNSRGGLLLYSDSLWDTSTILTVQTIEPAKGALKVYPNPARGYFVCSVEGVDLSNAKVELFNVIGEGVSVNANHHTDRVVINTRELSRGFYVVRIINSGKVYTAKILVE